MSMPYPNCLTYLDHRGHSPLRRTTFGPVDGLLLSVCAYAPFEKAITPNQWLPLPKAVERLKKQPDWDAVGLLMAKDTPSLVSQLPRSPRFRGMLLGRCETLLTEDAQFAAVTFRLEDGSLFLAFRGTDDTLTGWKECFAMSYSPAIPAQRLALDYLVRTAASHPGRLRLGGHSKGGNLAVYAAVHASPEVRRRILTVYNYDGPGFARDLTHTRPYRALADRIMTYVPQSSLVGALLHQDNRARVVKSHGHNIAGQHDPFTWEVAGSTFRFLPHRSRHGEREAVGFRSWVESMTPPEREEFTEVFFSLLTASRSETLSELSDRWTDTALAALTAYRALPTGTRRDMADYLRRFLLSMGAAGRPFLFHNSKGDINGSH